MALQQKCNKKDYFVWAPSKRHRMVQNGTELVQNGTECLKGTEWYRIKVSKRHRMVQNESV